MRPSNLQSKLVGSDDERAVSPVIGVILMVAITVILAAVIAAFVLDLGDSVDSEAQAGVNIDVDEGEDEIQIEITSIGNADEVNIAGSVAEDSWYDGEDWEDRNGPVTGMGVGDVAVIGVNDADADVNIDDATGSDEPAGPITAVAVIEEDDTETQVASEDFDFSS